MSTSRTYSSKRLKMNLFITLLKSLRLTNPSLEDVITDITLGIFMHKFQHQPSLDVNSELPTKVVCFDPEELAMFSTPTRYHLSSSDRRALKDRIDETLLAIASLAEPGSENIGVSHILQCLRSLKDDLAATALELDAYLEEIDDLTTEINTTRKSLDSELDRLLSETFPAYDAARLASIDLVGASIESSLIKLSLVQVQSEHGVYNHGSKKDPGSIPTLAKALDVAYADLKKEEREMRTEIKTLDHQLQEYESLLQLVDGSKDGYQQIVDDWTRVKNETEECKRDLRRLGWSGDRE